MCPTGIKEAFWIRRATNGVNLRVNSPLLFCSFRLFDEQKDVLILVFLEDIPTAELSPYYRMRKVLKRRTYVSWPRAEGNAGLFWQKVCQALKTREDHGDDPFLLTVVDNH